MDILDEHFHTKINIGFTVFNDVNPVTWCRIASNDRANSDAAANRATLWLREPLPIGSKLFSTPTGHGSSTFFIHDNLEVAGKIYRDNTYAYRYSVLRTIPTPLTLLTRTEQVAASGVVIGETLTATGTLLYHHLLLEEVKDYVIPSSLKTERSIITATKIESEADTILQINSDQFRITSVTADKNLWRVTIIGA